MAATYMHGYFSKQEDDTSETMKQTATKVCLYALSNFRKMKAVARAYSAKR